MIERKLDRLPEFDERSRSFPIRALVEDKPRRSYTWSVKVFLDQGPDGACVGFSWAHDAAARPKIVPNVDDLDAFDLYHRARQLDQWPGEGYEGTSVIAGAKAMQERGWLREYRWAFSETDLALAVGYKGPAVLGINWYTGMFQPDSNGFIKPTGVVEGGHAILCHSYSIQDGGFYRVHNSWGQGWGEMAVAKIRREDMARLLSEQGEACIPTFR
jgi:hypothetical protein